MDNFNSHCTRKPACGFASILRAAHLNNVAAKNVSTRSYTEELSIII
jgi:hypothetical protein